MIFMEKVENGHDSQGQTHFSPGGHIRGEISCPGRYPTFPLISGGIVGTRGNPECLPSGFNILVTFRLNLVPET